MKRPTPTLDKIEARREEICDLLVRYSIRQTADLTGFDKTTLAKWVVKNKIKAEPYRVPPSHPWRKPWSVKAS
jgi:hypothetical protein